MAAIFVEDLMVRPAVTVRDSASLPEVEWIMARRHVDFLSVVDDEDRFVGVVTRSDLNVDEKLPPPRRVRMRFDPTPVKLRRALARSLAAGDVMSTPPVALRAEASAAEAAALMRARGVRRVPVVDAAGRVVGVLGQEDLLEALIPTRMLSRLTG